MKKIILLFLLLNMALSVNAGMLLTGEVEYTTDSARNELMKTTPDFPELESFLLYIKDQNYKENVSNLLKGTVEVKDRTLALFSDNSYAVMYHENPLKVFYYSQDGNLTHIEIKDKTDYPYKSYKYDINGNLVNMGLRISKAETYIFSPNGKLIAHWLKENAYDEHNNLIMKRKYLE